MPTNTGNRTEAKETCRAVVGGQRVGGQIVDGQVFTIDRDLYIRRSTVFKKALEDASTQQSSSSTPAPISFEGSRDCNPEAFGLYKTFVEDGFVDCNDSDDVVLFLIRIYELALQLKDFTEANSAIDMIIDNIKGDEDAPNLQHIRQVYESPSLPGDCHLKQLLVDFQIHDPRDMLFLEYMYEDGHNDRSVLEFLQDVAVEYQAIAGGKGDRGKVGEANDIFGNKPGDRDICYHYHKHDLDHKNLKCPGVGSKEADEDSAEARDVSEEVDEESEDSGESDEEP